MVCVRICAPMPFRTRTLMKRLGIADPAAARREIERNDAAHNGTMRRLFGVDWTDAAHYALTLNTQRVPVANCVEQIALLSSSEPFRETQQSRAILIDQLIETRVRMTLDEHFDGRIRAVGIDVQVKDGKATLSGAISDERLIAEIVRRVHAVEGVTQVESNIQFLAFTQSRGYL